MRVPPSGPAQVSALKLVVGEQAVAEWTTWFQALTADPDRSDALEKQAVLEIADKRKVLLTLKLEGLGVVRIARGHFQPACAGPSQHGVYEVELYCEKMSVVPPPGPFTVTPIFLPGVLKAAEPAPPAAPVAGHPDDKGARDPEGLPRPEGAVRTAFTSVRSKTHVDETADYATKEEAAVVERFFTGEMTRRGWTLAYRTETGKDLGYAIDLRWELERRQARVVIAKAKDGSTTVHLRSTAPVR